MVEAAQHPASPVRGAKLWPMSIEAYHVLGEAGVIPENTELLYGFVYTKMPKSPLHSFLLYRLLAFLQQLALRDRFIRAEQPLTFLDSEPEPDLAVLKGTNEDFRFAHPQTAELVIEVCVTSHEYDRSKLRAYATGGVLECWLVLGPERQIEIHSEPRDGVYTQVVTHGPGGSVRSQVLSEFVVDLDVLFAH
jgi:Uma2 family endonuclease